MRLRHILPVAALAFLVASLVWLPIPKIAAQDNSKSKKPVEEVYQDAPTQFTLRKGTTIFADPPQSTAATVGWAIYGNNLANWRFSDLYTINSGNAKDLVAKWAFAVGNLTGGTLQASPVIVDGMFYVADQLSNTFGLDAKTGQVIWSFKPGVDPVTAPRGFQGTVYRGVAFGDGKIFTVTADRRLFALDPKTGKPVESFGNKGQVDVDPKEAIRSCTVAPQIFEDKVIVVGEGSSRSILGGLVAAFNIKTGAPLWRFITIPQNPTDEGFAIADRTWASNIKDANGNPVERNKNGGGVWQTPSIDPQLRMIYFGSGDPAPFAYGGNRVGLNLFTNSLIALNVDTGKLQWFFQEDHHDLWDYDTAGTTALVDIQRPGGVVKAIAQAGKTGFLYVLDRATGQPVFPTPETPVETFTDLPGEAVFPTQPIPMTDPFISIGKVTDVSPSVIAALVASGVKPAVPFNPPTLKGSIVSPNILGGANYQPLSYSPLTKLLYVLGIDDPAVLAAAPIFEHARLGDTRAGISRFTSVRGALGTLSAYDLSTGKIVWQVKLDSAVQSGSCVTAGNVVFAGEANGYFNAYNATTGERLWRFQTGSGIFGAPVVYAVDGEAFVAVASGGTGFAGSPNKGATYFVFGLK